MREVTSDNFKDIYPEIEENIKSADVIAIDCEFSGLSSRTSDCNLLDSSSERYIKLRKNVQNIVPLQIGVTVFHRVRGANEYVGNVYTFYVFPRAVLSLKQQFAAQSAGIHFLCKYGFDFNKCIYKGISYLNREQEIQLKENLKSYEQYICFEWITQLDRLESSLSIWVQQAQIGDIMKMLEFPANGRTNYNIIYILFRKLNQRFPSQLWIYKGNDYLTVKKVSKREYDEKESLESFFIDSCVGFTKVFQLIANTKKPILGHNMLLDLLIMYKEFERSLPSSYSLFRKEILRVFPTIYDTKHMSYNLRELTPKTHVWKSNGLSCLYKYFKDKQGRHLAFYSPEITLAEGSQVDTEMFHNAGWDSYCTGYCFLRMAHIYACNTYVYRAKTGFYSTGEYLKAVEFLKNILNLRCSSIPCMKLEDKDPPSTRPPLLFVEAVKGRLNMHRLAYMFGNCGYVELKACSEKTALVACGNYWSIRNFHRKYSKDKDIRIREYNRLRDTNALRLIILSGLSTFSGIFLLGWITYKAVFPTEKISL